MGAPRDFIHASEDRAIKNDMPSVGFLHGPTLSKLVRDEGTGQHRNLRKAFPLGVDGESLRGGERLQGR